MPMLVIEGTYKVVGARPDGDSVRFYANRPDHWNLVGGPHRVRLNAAGGAQFRLDGIDSLETHYAGPCRDRASRTASSASGSSGTSRYTAPASR